MGGRMSPPRRRNLRIRHVIAALTLLFVLAAGAATIALIVPAAVARLRALGQQQAALLANDALQRVTQLYTAPMQQLDAMTNLTMDTSDFDWPSASVAAHHGAARLHDHAAAAVVASDPSRAFVLMTYYLDGSAFQVSVNSPMGARVAASQCVRSGDSSNLTTGTLDPPDLDDAEQLAAYRARNVTLSTFAKRSTANTGGGVPPALPRCEDGQLHFGGGGAEQQDGNHTLDIYGDARFFGRPTTPARFFIAGTFGGHSAITIGVAAYDRGNSTAEQMFMLASPLRVQRRAPPALNQLVGFSVIATSFATLQRGLCELSRSAMPGWRAVVVGSAALIAATSECRVESLGVMERDIPADSRERKRFCFSPFEVSNALEYREDRGKYCVDYLYASPDPVLRALFPFFKASFARESQGLRATTPALMDLDGESYFVSAGFPTIGRYTGSSGPVITIVPEAAVVGAVLEANYIAVGAAAACTLVAAVAAALLIAALTRPLPRIAERLGDAAAMRDTADGRTGTLAAASSCFAELDPMQEAAAEMEDELARVRSFVPASVRLALGRDGSGGGRSAWDAQPVRGSSRHSDDGLASSSVRGAPSVFTAATSGGGGSGRSPLRRGLQRKRITVVVARAVEFANAISSVAADASHRLVIQPAAELVELVEGLAWAHHGALLHYAGGETFTVTFNAVRPCASHASEACRFATRLHQTLLRDAAGARVGVATGICLVGNAGSAATRAYTVLGPAVEQARALERMTVLYGPGCFGLASQETLDAAASVVPLATVDLIAYPDVNADDRHGTAFKGTDRPSATASHRVRGRVATAFQRVAAILDPDMPWHDAGGRHSGRGVTAGDDDGDAAAPNYAASAASERDAAVAGWLEMSTPFVDDGSGAGEHLADSPLWRWNRACRVLLLHHADCRAEQKRARRRPDDARPSTLASSADADVTCEVEEMSLGALRRRRRRRGGPRTVDSGFCPSAAFRVDHAALLPALLTRAGLRTRIEHRFHGRSSTMTRDIAFAHEWMLVRDSGGGHPSSYHHTIQPLRSLASSHIARLSQRWLALRAQPAAVVGHLPKADGRASSLGSIFEALP